MGPVVLVGRLGVEGDLVTFGAKVLMGLASCGPLEKVLKLISLQNPRLPAPQRAPCQSAVGEVLELMALQQGHRRQCRRLELLTSVLILGLETL